MIIYEIGSYQEEEIKVTMTTTSEARYDDLCLKKLYEQAVKRLMTGIRGNPDEAIKQLRATNPKRVKEVTDALMENYTAEGINAFETSFRKGFKKIGVWNIQANEKVVA